MHQFTDDCHSHLAYKRKGMVVAIVDSTWSVKALNVIIQHSCMLQGKIWFKPQAFTAGYWRFQEWSRLSDQVKTQNIQKAYGRLRGLMPKTAKLHFVQLFILSFNTAIQHMATLSQGKTRRENLKNVEYCHSLCLRPQTVQTGVLFSCVANLLLMEAVCRDAVCGTVHKILTSGKPLHLASGFNYGRRLPCLTCARTHQFLENIF